RRGSSGSGIRPVTGAQWRATKKPRAELPTKTYAERLLSASLLDPPETEPDSIELAPEPLTVRVLRAFTLFVFAGLVIGLVLGFAYPERVATMTSALRSELGSVVSRIVWAVRLATKL